MSPVNMPRPKSRWKNIEWNRPIGEIATQLGVTKAAVVYQRKKHISSAPSKSSRWDSVDWTRPDAEIAAEFGITRAAVFMQRKKRTKIKPMRRSSRGTATDAIQTATKKVAGAIRLYLFGVTEIPA